MARRLRNWLEAYVTYTIHSEAPLEYHYWTAVSAVAGALRRKVYFDQKIYQWSPNFYIIFVAPPGIAKKSSTIDIGYSMLREVPTVQLGPATITWQAIPKLLVDSRLDWDITGGSGDLLEREYFPMCCLSFGASELGNLIQFDNKELIDLLVNLWDGKRNYDKVTKFSGSEHVVNPWINLIAGVTPAWLKANLNQVLIGGGFVSRCIFVYAEGVREPVAYPADLMDGSFDALRDDLVHDLSEIGNMYGQYRLSSEAHSWGTAWYQTVHQGLVDTTSATSANFRARVQCHVHKLAMVIAAAQGDELVIDQPTLQQAAMLTENAEKALIPIFRTADALPEMVVADDVFNFVKKYKKVNRIVLYNYFRHRFRFDGDFQKALDSGRAAGKLAFLQEGNSLFIRWAEPEEGELRVAQSTDGPPEVE